MKCGNKNGFEVKGVIKLNDIKVSEGLNRKNAEKVCNWTNKYGEKFLRQWAGPALTFPLTVEEINKQHNLYSIFLSDEFVGMIQKIRVEEGNVHIGRFLINPEKTGAGIGGYALSEFTNMIFLDTSINSISLAVLSDNEKARRLYEKYGFEVYETVDDAQKKYMMRKIRDCL